MYVFARIYIYIHIRVCVYIYLFIYLFIYLLIYLYIYRNIYIYIYIYIYGTVSILKFIYAITFLACQCCITFVAAVPAPPTFVDDVVWVSFLFLLSSILFHHRQIVPFMEFLFYELLVFAADISLTVGLSTLCVASMQQLMTQIIDCSCYCDRCYYSISCGRTAWLLWKLFSCRF